MTSTFLRFAIASLATITVASCARATNGARTTPEPDSARNAQLEAIYRARLDSARMRFTEADVRFMTSMIAHHAQAVVAARMAESHGASPLILTLAGRIINAQQDEIATMEQWLRDRRQPVPKLHIEGTSAMMHGGTHVHMPGMLTAEQMRQLDEARGAEFDRLFLVYMIQHHRGAVTMVRELFATDGAGQDEEVFKFASDVQVDQSTEVARMELMLAELTAADRTP
jgi:uncharacterized protein (DUF305 family)